jgi:hypothetical protein
MRSLLVSLHDDPEGCALLLKCLSACFLSPEKGGGLRLRETRPDPASIPVEELYAENDE